MVSKIKRSARQSRKENQKRPILFYSGDLRVGNAAYWGLIKNYLPRKLLESTVLRRVEQVCRLTLWQNKSGYIQQITHYDTQIVIFKLILDGC